MKYHEQYFQLLVKQQLAAVDRHEKKALESIVCQRHEQDLLR
jgi:hypothetical protein